MPTYDLECRGCGERFEKFVMRLLAEADRVCPKCGSTDVRCGVGGGILGAGTKQSASASCSPGAIS